MDNGRIVYICGAAQAAACEVCVFRIKTDDGHTRCELERCVCSQQDEAAYG